MVAELQPNWEVAYDIEYLKSVLPATTEEEFFEYLHTVDASEVSISSAPEGSIVFSRVPLLQVRGPLLVVQLMETTLLCLVNYASRPGQEADGDGSTPGSGAGWRPLGIQVLLRFDFTSNVLAGKLYGIPAQGTLAHSYVSSFTSVDDWLIQVCQLLRVPLEKVSYGERAAFMSGIPNFCAVALALNQLGYRAIGVRLDSGDLAKQSVEIRHVPWFETIPITVSNDVSEQSLEELSQEGNEIDMIGVGTHLVTCPLQTTLGCVYKLVEVNGSPRLKVTEDPEKTTLPGRKVVYRLWDEAGFPCMDLMALEEESAPEAGQEVEYWSLGGTEKAGKAHAQTSLDKLNPVHKRLQDPEAYQSVHATLSNSALNHMHLYTSLCVTFSQGADWGLLACWPSDKGPFSSGSPPRSVGLIEEPNQIFAPAQGCGRPDAIAVGCRKRDAGERDTKKPVLKPAASKHCKLFSALLRKESK
ncbi:hypothetical protein E2320_011782, partial [Naja naja]